MRLPPSPSMATAIASGDLREVRREQRKESLERRQRDASILVFDGSTSLPIDIDLRGTVDDVLARLPDDRRLLPATEDSIPHSALRGPGRPKLGVVAREITLAAAALGVAGAAKRRRVGRNPQTGRGSPTQPCEQGPSHPQAQEAAYRFISVMAGNAPHYEDAIRALFAGDRNRFRKIDCRTGPLRCARPCLANRLAERAFRHETQAARRLIPPETNR